MCSNEAVADFGIFEIFWLCVLFDFAKAMF